MSQFSVATNEYPGNGKERPRVPQHRDLGFRVQLVVHTQCLASSPGPAMGWNPGSPFGRP